MNSTEPKNEQSTHELVLIYSEGDRQNYVGAKYRNSDLARYYATKHDKTLTKRISNWRERRVMANALNMLAPFESVIDLPTGTGRFWETLAGYDIQLLGSDRSAEMLKLTARFDPLLKRQPLRFVSSALEIPLPDKSVDVVFCSRLFHHFPDHQAQVALLKELGQIARKGVVVSFFDAASWKHRRRLRRQARSHKLSQRYGVTRDEITQEAHEAGLAPLGMYALLRGFAELTAVAFRHEHSAV